jgi:hypothetical protein
MHIPYPRGSDRYYDAVIRAFIERHPDYRSNVIYLNVPGHTPGEPFMDKLTLRACIIWAHGEGLVGQPGNLDACLADLDAE